MPKTYERLHRRLLLSEARGLQVQTAWHGELPTRRTRWSGSSDAAWNCS